jgi:hypothetical protein
LYHMKIHLFCGPSVGACGGCARICCGGRGCSVVGCGCVVGGCVVWLRQYLYFSTSKASVFGGVPAYAAEVVLAYAWKALCSHMRCCGLWLSKWWLCGLAASVYVLLYK